MTSKKITYDDDLKVKDALQIYFSNYHFENGGYDLKYFKIKLGPVYIPFPNIKARVDAVKIHDIHHLVTEYKANLKGESEIGAWEIASGCGKVYIGWILNSASFFYGMFFFPRSLFNAFMSGRKCKTNLYYNTVYNQQLLNQTVGEIRNKIGIREMKKNSVRDYFYFGGYCLILLLPMALALTLLIKFLS